MKRYKDGKDLFITEFSSIGEFISTINSLPNNRFFEGRELTSQRKENNDDGWCKSCDYSRATYLLTHGWDSAAKQMAQKVKLTDTVAAPVRTTKSVYSVIGSQASVPRYLQGIPTNMISRQTTYAKQKVITVTKGISYSGWWTSEDIMKESIKALELIQSLETSGQRVRLNVMLATGINNKNAIYKVCVKQPDERLNISKMAFALAHPSMLRRFFFRCIETDPFIKFDLTSSYGFPSSLPIKERALAENEYYIPEKIENMNALIEQLKSGKPRKSV